jgi:hypothetical protein
LSCEARVPLDHPLRPIQKIVDKALDALTGEFEKLYVKLGRPSIPPEKLLRALLLQNFPCTWPPINGVILSGPR